MNNQRTKLKGIGIALIALLILQVIIPVIIYAASDIATTKYKVSEGYITKIMAGETVKTFLENVSSNEGKECVVYKGETIVAETENIATGMTLKVGTNTYTLVVTGDLNQDGKVTTTDLSMLMKNVVNKLELTGAKLKAADLNYDGKISTVDVSRLKMVLVGLALPEDGTNVSGEIIINVSTEEPTRSLIVSVQWPDEIEGLTKQISVNNGKTFTSNIDQATVNENTTVIARLVDSTSKVVKSASLKITNIDNVAPVQFAPEAEHTIANYITLKGSSEDAYKYFFSKNNGTSWLPNNGLEKGEYTFTEVEPNTKISLRMKAEDKVGNETITEVIEQRTFKKGIDILEERLSGVQIDKANETIILPDGRVYKLTTTATGGYRIQEIGNIGEAQQIVTDESSLNQKIEAFEKNGVKTTGEIYEHITEDGIGIGAIAIERIAIEKAAYYNMYTVVTKPDGTHEALFVEQIKKNFLTTSGQIEEQKLLDSINEILDEMNENDNFSISEALTKAVTQGLLLDENVNRITGEFQTEIGTVYRIDKIETIEEESEEGEIFLTISDLLGTVEEVENGIIEQRMLEEIVIAVKNKVIDWYIEDGITTEVLVDREYGMFETITGEYKEIFVNAKEGSYGIVDGEKIDGSRITYTLTPDFPVMTNKVVMDVVATYVDGVSEIKIISGIGDILTTKTYSENPTNATLSFDITENGVYIIVAKTSDEKVTMKQVLVSHISSLYPIKVLIDPETPRNTEKTVDQNGVQTGPIKVSLQYSEALLLENTDKYQYKINDEEWKIASREQLITDIKDNCVIYARYWDGTKSLKQIRIDVDNVDNVAPEEFAFTTVVTSHSITVNADTTDTAADSKGNAAREGVAGIERYEYSLDGTTWQANSMFSKLSQQTPYTIYVKAIDNAGNERLATNNGSTITTTQVPKASDVVTFEYSTTQLTNEAVTVNIKVGELQDISNIVQYQILERGQNETNLVEENWETGTTLDAKDNCVIYVRIVDVVGQTNPDGGYAIGNVSNIDNLAPQPFTPKVVARTQTSITVNASQNGAALDAEETAGSLSSGVVSYTYYLIPTSGNGQKIENVSEYTHKFEGLSAGKAYSIYVEAKDAAGNVKVSEQITTGTNAKVGQITDVTTTVNGVQETASYNNPVVPKGFKAVNTDGANWGDDQTPPSGWDKGLVLADKEENQFVWVPVDGTNVKYEKWLNTGINHTSTQDAENIVDETIQIEKYKGYYIGRYEAGKSSAEIVSKVGETALTATRYESAKEKAENMYETTSVQSGLTTGKQWDTLLKWISNEEDEDYVKTDTTWGNYTGTKENTGKKNDWKVKNIFDIEGNVQELTNEFENGKVVVRGGAYNNEVAAAHRSSYNKEIAAVNTGFRVVLYVVDRDEYTPEGEGVLGIGNYNPGPGNITVNGLENGYSNPVVPVGFKAINTDGAKWTGVTPSGWNNGLVIEDVNGNQFVWVPVDGNIIKYVKGEIIWEKGAKGEIIGDEIPKIISDLGDNEKTQIEEYEGFYIARYEAGNEEGDLASKAGLKTVNAIDYVTAKGYAESMYNTAYVKSGLPTGTSWDTMTKWIENQYGKTYVTKNAATGNSFYNTFTFSGEYAAGPNSPTETRGNYQIGNNTTKAANQAYLLATGLIDNFKSKNIYDLAGNVWEYTTEYCTGAEGNVHVARGSDYYRHSSGNGSNVSWGIAMREALLTPPGEVRNESGFRVMLYLSEEGAKEGVFEDYNRTIDGKGATYKNPIIPAGFAPVNKGSNWGNGNTIAPEWNNGLVIEDATGNQFVWVPVYGTNVEYKKWTTRGITYKMTDGDLVPSSLEDWNETEKTQINKYGGFYVARYEISKGTEDEAKSVENKEPWINITWENAKEKAESMIQKNTVATGLITGTQWDSLLRWVANEKGEEAVVDDSTSWGNYANSDLGRAAKAKNIYEIAGGSWEWTAEYKENNKIFRGGVSTDTGASSPAAYRDEYSGGEIDKAITFRTVLYITGEVLGIAKKPVQDSERLPGTAFPTVANEPVLGDGMIPVKWSGAAWVETTVNDPYWYAYNDATVNGANTSKWANAMTPDGSLFVWIPRYAYKLSGGTQVQFLDGTSNLPSDGSALNGTVHPVFRNAPSIGGWDKELSGIWVSKYMVSANSQTGLASKPGLGAYRNQEGGALYSSARNANFGFTSAQKSKVDTHMIKNTEWGAVSFLTHSKYGLNGTLSGSTSTGNEYGIVQHTGNTIQYVAGVLNRDSIAIRYGNGRSMLIGGNKYTQYYDYALVGNYESAHGLLMGYNYESRWVARKNEDRLVTYKAGKIYLYTGNYYGDAMYGEYGYWSGDMKGSYYKARPYLLRSGFNATATCWNSNEPFGTSVVLITE